MAKGQGKGGVENYQLFLSWMSRKSKDDYRQMHYRGQLSRKEIATECGFGRSALTQNKYIREELGNLENNLRKHGVLPKIIENKSTDKLPERDISKTRNTLNLARLSKLEQEATALRAENDHLKLMLKKYQLLDKAIAESGRMPR